jgi:SAM-dependent methyltransferase
MTARPRLLDLFCGPGGAARGYQLAGFHVTGVDLSPQPNYCGDEFLQRDAIQVLEYLADRAQPWPGAPPFDAIHASPTCQHHANVTAWRGDRDDHPDLLTPSLELLARIKTPWIVENVPEALPTWDYVLCGSQFGLALGGKTIKRHRGFRRGNWTGFSLLPPCDHRNLRPFMHKDERAFADAMGCTWMNKAEARQAIPPAYTEYLAGLLLGALDAGRAA